MAASAPTAAADRDTAVAAATGEALGNKESARPSWPRIPWDGIDIYEKERNGLCDSRPPFFFFFFFYFTSCCLWFSCKIYQPAHVFAERVFFLLLNTNVYILHPTTYSYFYVHKGLAAVVPNE